MPYGIGYPPDALAALGGQNAAYQDANPQGGMGEDNPLAALLALLQAPQDEPEQPDFPIPQEPNRAQIIGAIMQQALGNPQGAQMLQGMRQDRQGAMQQQAMQQQAGGLRREGIQQRLMDSVMDAIAAQNRETGLNERFEDRLGMQQSQFADRMGAREREFTEREGRMLREFDEREARLRAEFAQNYGIKEGNLNVNKAKLGLMQDRNAIARDFNNLRAAMRQSGRPLPAGSTEEFTDLTNALRQARHAQTIFTDLGQPGTAPGAGLLPMRLRSKAFKDWAALWTSVRAPIRKGFQGTAQTESEKKDLEDLLIQVGTDPGSTESALNAIIQMFDAKVRERLDGFKAAKFDVGSLEELVKRATAGPETEEAPAVDDEDFGEN